MDTAKPKHDEVTAGWSLPSGWSLVQLEEIGEINPKFMSRIVDDIDVTYLPMRCVQERTGYIDLSLTRKLSEVRKGYTYFVDGDVLFANGRIK